MLGDRAEDGDYARELVLGGVLAEAVPAGVYQRSDLRILPVQGTE